VPFVLVGISHRTAPVEIREQVYVPRTLVGECVRRLIDHDFIDSGVLLSTCNRTELYAVAGADGPPHRLVDAFGLWPHELAFAVWQRHAYQLSGDDALTHLFEVACGLDSVMVGEGQILGQMREALAEARSAGVMDPKLEIIMHGALRAGRRTRHETEIGRKPVSVAHAAVAKSIEVLGDLRGRGVLVVGTGPMSQAALALLRNHGIGSLFVTSRTIERADRIGRVHGSRALSFDAIVDVIAEVDIILSSTGAPHLLFDRSLVEQYQERRGGRALLMIDMAVPRDMDPEVNQVTGVRLLNIDDLQTIADANREERRAWISVAQRIIEEEVRATRRALESRESADAIKNVVNRAEHMRDDVLTRHLARVPAGDARTRAAMRALATALTARFLHGPIRLLRESPEPALESAVLDAAFGPDEDPA
jgi:glutamyl-tRNA reductase